MSESTDSTPTPAAPAEATSPPTEAVDAIEVAPSSPATPKRRVPPAVLMATGGILLAAVGFAAGHAVGDDRDGHDRGRSGHYEEGRGKDSHDREGHHDWSKDRGHGGGRDGDHDWDKHRDSDNERVFPDPREFPGFDRNFPDPREFPGFDLPEMLDENGVPIPAPGAVYLGVRLTPAEDGTATAKVGEVAKDSPAEAAGILAGDVITKIDETSITNGTEIREAVNAHKDGDEITITVKRGEETKEVKATLQLRFAGTTQSLPAVPPSNPPTPAA